MNKNALQKCVVELKQEKPKIDYVLGILETLIDLPINHEYISPTVTPSDVRSATVSQEEDIPAFLRVN